MPNPSQVSAQNINTELGVGSTTLIQLNNNWVRNVASKSSGQISYGDCRWGINFPGGEQFADNLTPANSYNKTYSTSPNLDLSGYDISLTTAVANTSLKIGSDGTLTIESTAGATYNIAQFTWLTSGSNSDYTANLYVNSDTTLNPNYPSTTNVDHSLSETRQWRILAASGGGDAQGYANCDLIIKSGGTELFRRRITMFVLASVPN
jgi:hypothetical protein